MVLTAYFVLSPVSEFVLSPSSADFRFCRTRSGRLNLRKFNTSNGCQDHTALPSAYSAVRQRAVNRSRGSTRPAIRHTPDAAASTASRPASVTIAIRPSVGRDGEGYRSDLGKAGTKIFLQTGLDRQFTDLPVGHNQPNSSVIARSEAVGWTKRSVPTIQDNDRLLDGGHGAKSAFAHPTRYYALRVFA